MFKKIAQIKILNNCFVLYLATVILFTALVNHKKVIYKTLDSYALIPDYLVSFSRSEQKGFGLPRSLESLRYCNSLIKIFPDNYRVVSMLGFCYYHLGKRARAIHYYKKAAQLEGEEFGLYYNLGLLYFEARQFRQAVVFLEKAAAIAPSKVVNDRTVVNPFEFETSPAQDMNPRLAAIKMSYARVYEMLVWSYFYLKNFDSMYEAALLGMKDYTPEIPPFSFYAALAGAYRGKYETAMELLDVNMNEEAGGAQAVQLSMVLKKILGVPENERGLVWKKEAFAAEPFSPKEGKLFYFPALRSVEIEGKRTYTFM